MKEYDSPEVTEYGAVADITEASGTNKEGSGSDEYSHGSSLTGTVF
jgi:hypothetical protein